MGEIYIKIPRHSPFKDNFKLGQTIFSPFPFTFTQVQAMVVQVPEEMDMEPEPVMVLELDMVLEPDMEQILDMAM